MTVDLGNRTNTTRKARVAGDALDKVAFLQVSALFAVFILWVCEFWLTQNTAWGPDSCWWVIGADGFVFLVSVVILWPWIRAQFRDSNNSELDVYTSGIKRVYRLFVLDVVGLLFLMLIAGGSLDFLTPFTVIVAVSATVMCPRTDARTACPGCGNPELRFRRWFIGESLTDSGWSLSCRGLVTIVVLAATLGVLLGRFLLTLNEENIINWTSLPAHPVSLTVPTTVAFAIIGMWQFLYARWYREQCALQAAQPEDNGNDPRL